MLRPVPSLRGQVNTVITYVHLNLQNMNIANQ